MNLAVLKKSRKAPQVGDIFVMLPPDGLFLYGRVISTNANPLGIGGAILIYIYQIRSKEKKPIPELSRERLLVPPIMTNRLPWTKGYFELVESRALGIEDELQQHCFVRDWDVKTYFDEHGTQLSKPVEPIGQWGLHSYRTIDDEISQALSIPLAPD